MPVSSGQEVQLTQLTCVNSDWIGIAIFLLSFHLIAIEGDGEYGGSSITKARANLWRSKVNNWFIISSFIFAFSKNPVFEMTLYNVSRPLEVELSTGDEEQGGHRTPRNSWNPTRSSWASWPSSARLAPYSIILTYQHLKEHFRTLEPICSILLKVYLRTLPHPEQCEKGRKPCIKVIKVSLSCCWYSDFLRAACRAQLL